MFVIPLLQELSNEMSTIRQRLALCGATRRCQRSRGLSRLAARVWACARGCAQASLLHRVGCRANAPIRTCVACGRVRVRLPCSRNHLDGTGRSESRLTTPCGRCGQTTRALHTRGGLQASHRDLGLTLPFPRLSGASLGVGRKCHCWQWGPTLESEIGLCVVTRADFFFKPM